MTEHNVAGDYIIPIPVGLEVDLRYDMDGVLEHIYARRASGDKPDITDKILNKLQVRNLVPTTIGLKGGTTWVSGVFYTGKTYRNSGKLPDCIEDSIIADICNTQSPVSFFASSVRSKVVNFTMAAPSVSWLKMNRFNVLNGRLYYPGVTAKFYESLMHGAPHSLTGPIQSLAVFTHNRVEHRNLGLEQKEVIRHNQVRDDDGTIKIAVDFLGNETMNIHYALLAGHRMGRGTVLTLKSGGAIAQIDSVGGPESEIPKAFTCPVCGAKIVVKDHLAAKCSYKFCESRLLPRVSQFIRELNLPPLSLDELKEAIAEKKLTTLLDILDIYTERGIRIRTTVSRLMSAIISYEEVRRRDSITKFVNACNNNETSVMFYLKNTDKMYTLLSRDANSRDLIAWAEVHENVLELMSFLDDNNVEVDKIERKFEGAPMFRNNTFLITGKFRHGSLADVAAILQSYSATIVTEFTDKVSCVIVGDTAADIDGVAVQAAKSANIPVVQESDFFATYEIDHDLFNLV